MLSIVTTLLELGGLGLVIGGLAVAAALLAPAGWGLPCALVIGGLGLVGLSFLITRRAKR